MPPSILKKLYDLLNLQGDPMEGWPDESFHPGDAEDEDESLGRDLKMVKALSRSLEYTYNTGAVSSPLNTKAYLEEMAKTHLVPRGPAPHFHMDDHSPVSLEEFIYRIPLELEKCSSQALKKCEPIKELMHRVFLTKSEIEFYGLFEPSKLYTRNLVATDGKTFTLLLLCWNPGKESPIHDHPCEGCWVKGIAGQAVETVYEMEGEELKVIKESKVMEGDIAYMDDSLGLHKVGNPHPTQGAITMHLYSPPYQSCKSWFNTNATTYCRTNVTFFSMYGHKVEV